MARARIPDLDAVVDLFPSEIQGTEVRNRLKSLSRELDRLVVEDRGQLLLDTGAIDRVFQEYVPAGVRERVDRGVRSHLHDKLTRPSRPERLRWRELRERDNPIEPVSVARLRELGLGADVSADDARAVLLEKYPELRPIINSDGPELKDVVHRAIQHNRTVWDCCVARLGWWGALAVFAAVGAFLIVGTATGPWGIPLAIWLIAVLGGGTGVIVANCVLNPNR